MYERVYRLAYNYCRTTNNLPLLDLMRKEVLEYVNETPPVSLGRVAYLFDYNDTVTPSGSLRKLFDYMPKSFEEIVRKDYAYKGRSWKMPAFGEEKPKIPVLLHYGHGYRQRYLAIE